MPKFAKIILACIICVGVAWGAGWLLQRLIQ
jgi:hypothetical protein